ncbi:MAG TPA: hypothetical protein VK483_03725 [Chitinophagaceae bacterium]|nr:hypothetical protein [Chitinophagaceae bacterium]
MAELPEILLFQVNLLGLVCPCNIWPLFSNAFELINILHLWQLLYCMDNSFFAYLQQLELLAFFSGYPLICAATLFIAGNQQPKTGIKGKLITLLPLAYALVGTLYIGFQLRNLYPDYSFENIKATIQQPWLMLWGLLSILFWIPAFRKKIIYSLIHSLVFFFFLVKDLVLQISVSSSDKNIVRNDMKLYTDSLLLNLGALILVTLISLLINRLKKQKRSSHL